ncbi:uncharacterized protein LOC127845222 isoform X2 [Dreissena polymorpha]|uniref:uncharacterized protein LOC127845222 isoform X2 n=1 Tax=Dreissena polymorpha TaxID=45954 RepID=UPI002263BC37|nr:uncharacterized protein LOC127845222 isoform X2 [Dreissena polymorpha]
MARKQSKIKECLGKSSKSTPVRKRRRSHDFPEHTVNLTSENLPESPFPSTSSESKSQAGRKWPRTNDSEDQKTSAALSASVVSKSACNEVILAPSKTRRRQIDKSSINDNIISGKIGNTNMQFETPEIVFGNKDLNIEDRIEIGTGSTTGCSSTEFGSDSEDEDYIPRRKKLRSEVTKDELWEGIPLTVTFKRLTPLVKTDSLTPYDHMTTEGCQDRRRILERTDSSAIENISSDLVEECSSALTKKKETTADDNTNKEIFQSETDMDKKLGLHLQACGLYEEIVETDADECDKCQENSLVSPCKQKSMHIADKMNDATFQSSSLLSDVSSSIGAEIIAGQSTDHKVKIMTWQDNLAHTENELTKESSSTDASKNLSEPFVNSSMSISVGSIEQPSSFKNCMAFDFDEDESNQYSDKFRQNIKLESSRLNIEGAAQSELNQNISIFNDTSVHVIAEQMGAMNEGDCECEGRDSQLSESVSTTLEHIFNLEETDTKAQSTSQPPELSATTTKTTKVQDKIVSLEASTLILTPQRSKRLSEHATEQKTACEILEQHINDIKNSAETEGESEGQVIGQVSENAKLSSLQQMRHIFSKHLSVPKTIPPLRIKLKESHNYQGVTSSGASRESPGMTKSNKSSKKKSNKFKLKHRTTDLDESSNIGPENDGERHYVISGSEMSTANKKSTTTKRKDGTSKWSPSGCAGVELRLTSERRRSGAADLLNNPVLNTHACVLWSSENRRHVHLSNPDASLGEMDAILSRKWDALADKEKLRYFLRAKDALRDDNRHSHKAGNEVQRRSGDDEASSANGPETGWSRERFDKLAPGSQMAEIKRWLHYYQKVAPEVYTSIMREFKGRMMEERREKAETDEKQTRTPVKQRRTKLRKKDKRNSTGNDVKHRQLLFGMILSKRETVIAKLMTKKQQQKEALLAAYLSLVERLTSGDVIDFHGDVTSENLTERLSHIRALERDGKLAVVGDVTSSPRFDIVLSQLYDAGSRLTVTTGPAATDLPGARDLDIDALNPSLLQETLPCLSPATVRKVLSPISGYTPEDLPDAIPDPLPTTSPSSILTQWVADDILQVNPQIGFRKAISLLSGDKIVQRLIAPLSSNVSQRE